MQSLKRKSCKKGFKKIKVEFVRDDEILSGEQPKSRHLNIRQQEKCCQPILFSFNDFFFILKKPFF